MDRIFSILKKKKKLGVGSLLYIISKKFNFYSSMQVGYYFLVFFCLKHNSQTTMPFFEHVIVRWVSESVIRFNTFFLNRKFCKKQKISASSIFADNLFLNLEMQSLNLTRFDKWLKMQLYSLNLNSCSFEGINSNTLIDVAYNIS